VDEHRRGAELENKKNKNNGGAAREEESSAGICAKGSAQRVNSFMAKNPTRRLGGCQARAYDVRPRFLSLSLSGHSRRI